MTATPGMFKSVIGAHHPEFSSSRQQDAVEFFQHLLAQIDRAERASLHKGRMGEGEGDTLRAFQFEFEDRFECSESKRVMYV